MPIIDIFASVFELLGPIMALLDPMIQATLVGVAAITDLIKGVMFLFGKTDAFKGGSATIKQIGKAEVSAQQNYGKNFGLTKEGRESRVQDGIAPPGTGPFSIMDKNGNTTITAANDGLAVSPNITTVSSTLRPAGVVQQAPPPPTIDNDALGKIIGYHVAQAVSKVTVQTNLDGVALARGIQTPMGIATRK